MSFVRQAGKRTEFRIGKFLRQRYGAFLGDYRAGVLSARTTDWPRTKDSMALALAGLFPPAPQDAWDNDLGSMWTPIASECTPRDQDKVRVGGQRPVRSPSIKYASIVQ